MKTKKAIATASIVLFKWETGKDGKHPVKIRVIHKRKTKYFVLKGWRYNQQEWERITSTDKKNKKTRIDKETLKDLIRLEDVATDIINELDDNFSFDKFRTALYGENSKPQSIKEYIDQKVAKSKISTGDMYRALYKNLIAFDKKPSFEKINVNYITNFHNYLQKKELSHSSIGAYMRHFRHIINMAIADGNMKETPFGQADKKYTIPVTKKHHRALTKEQMTLLQNYESEDYSEKYYLKYFLFSYYCGGLNMIDIASLKYKDIEGDFFTFIRTKTKDTAKELPIGRAYMAEPVKQIISEIGNKPITPDSYIFPILKKGMTEDQIHNAVSQHGRSANKRLKRIAKKLGFDFDSFTMIYARHSFATISIKEGAPMAFISGQLAHKNISTTVTYIDSFKDDDIKKYSERL